MVDLNQMAHAITTATPRSLVLVDEFGKVKVTPIFFTVFFSKQVKLGFTSYQPRSKPKELLKNQNFEKKSIGNGNFFKTMLCWWSG